MLKTLRIIGIISLVLVVGAWFLYPKILNYFQSKSRKDYEKLQISGVVADSFLDYNRKGAFFVEIVNPKDTLIISNLYLEDTSEALLFQIGDSLYKESGYSRLRVFRGGSLIYKNY